MSKTPPNASAASRAALQALGAPRPQAQTGAALQLFFNLGELQERTLRLLHALADTGEVVGAQVCLMAGGRCVVVGRAAREIDRRISTSPGLRAAASASWRRRRRSPGARAAAPASVRSPIRTLPGPSARSSSVRLDSWREVTWTRQPSE